MQQQRPQAGHRGRGSIPGALVALALAWAVPAAGKVPHLGDKAPLQPVVAVGTDWRLVLDTADRPQCRQGEGACGQHTFTVTNAGIFPYVLPMTLRVHMPDGARLRRAQGIASAPSCPAVAWSCRQAGPLVSCAAPGCVLAAGEQVAVRLDIELSSDGAAAAPGGTDITLCGELETFEPPADVHDVEHAGAMATSRACGTGRILGPDRP